MRDYGIVSTAFWTDEKMQGASDQARLLALYLLAGPHSNIAGVMRVPVLYIADDLKWSTQAVDKSLKELIAQGFINRCMNSSWTLLKRYLNYNKPENPNQWKAVDKQIVAIPQHIRQVLEITRWLKPFHKQLPNSFEIQEQEQEQEQEHKHSVSNETSPDNPPEADLPGDPLTPASEIDPVPEAVSRWNNFAELHNLARVSRLNDQRKSKLRLRLKEAGGLSGWTFALDKIASQPWMLGDNDRGWKADFDFLLQPKSFTKLMEGGYDRKADGTSKPPRQSIADRLRAIGADPGRI